MKMRLATWAYIAAAISFIAGILGAIAYMGFGFRSLELFAPTGTILGVVFYLIAKRADTAT